MAYGDTVRISLGLDSGDAEKRLHALNMELGDTPKRAHKAADSLDHVADKAKRVEDNSGLADSVLQALAGAMDKVSPAGAEAARTMGDLSGGLEAIARLGGTTLAILGPVALAAGALGVAWRKTSADLEEAEKKMKAAEDRTRSFADAISKMREQQQLWNLEIMVANGNFAGQGDILGMTQTARSVEQARAGGREVIEAGVLRAGQQLTAAQQALQGRDQQRVDKAFLEETERLQKQLANAEANLKASKDALSKFDAETANWTAGLIEARQKVEEAAKNERAGLRSGGGGGGRGAMGPTGAVITTGGGDIRISEIAAGPTVSHVPMSASIGGMGDVATIQSLRQRTLGGIAGTAANIQASRFGTTMSDIGAVGGFLGGGFGALATLGSTMPGQSVAGKVSANLMGMKDAMVAALEALPEIIGEVIPDFAIGIVENVIPALIENAPAIFKSLIIDLPLGIAKALIGLPVVLMRGASEKIDNAIGMDTSDLKGPRRRMAQFAGFFERELGVDIPGFAKGTFTDRAMVAQLHPFERVVPASQVGSQTTDAAMGASAGGGGMGGNQAINFYGPVLGGVDGIMREIDRRIASGAGFSNAIAGVSY